MKAPPNTIKMLMFSHHFGFGFNMDSYNRLDGPAVFRRNRKSWIRRIPLVLSTVIAKTYNGDDARNWYYNSDIISEQVSSWATDNEVDILDMTEEEELMFIMVASSWK